MSRLSFALVCLLIAGCWSADSPPSNAPANLTVSAGENKVALRWDDAQAGLTYWAFYKPGTTVTAQDDGAGVAIGLTSPAVVAGLVNDIQYAFLVNGHNNDSKGGPSSAVVTATPRLLSPAVPWTVGTPLTTHDLKDISFGNNYYVAVGDAGSVFIAPHSYPDAGGVTAWSRVTTLPAGAAAANFVSALYDGTRFLALAGDGTVVISSSNTDVVDWSAATTIPGVSGMHALAAGAGAYIAVGDGGVIERNIGAGATGTWAPQVSGTTQDLYGVSYLNGLFIAVGGGGTLLTSADGVTWTARVTNVSGALRHTAYGLGIGATAASYVAVGDAGAIVSSPDAVTWTAQTLPTTQSLYSVVFGPDLQFIAVGTNGTLAYSLTGADGTWATANAGSIDLYGLAPADAFIAVGAAGSNVSGK